MGGSKPLTVSKQNRVSYVLARMRLLSLWSWLRLWRLLQASATFTFAQCLELWAKQNLPSIKLLSSKYLITAEGNETSIWIKVYNRLFCKGWTWWLALNTHHHPVTEAGHRISSFFLFSFILFSRDGFPLQPQWSGICYVIKLLFLYTVCH